MTAALAQTITKTLPRGGTSAIEVPPSRHGEPLWALATFYPPQGEWTEQAYLGLETNCLIEFKDGWLEFLPMPSPLHQLLARFLFLKLYEFVAARKLGEVFFAPLRTRTIERHIREPDVLFVKREQLPDLKQPPQGAQLVIEIISPGNENRARDEIEKRAEYAAAGIPEYWLVDPEARTIEVLTLDTGVAEYRLHGRFLPGDAAASRLLPGFEIDVTECFCAGEA